MAARYELQLLDASDMSLIGDISELTGKNLDLVYNGAGAMKVNMPMTHEFAGEALGAQAALRVKRNGVSLWSGPIWGRQGDFFTNRIEITAVGWLETLDSRVLDTVEVYQEKTDAYIANDLITKFNLQDPASPLWVSNGVNTGSFQLRDKRYEKGQKLATALKDLSRMEAGFDIFIHPDTRAMNLRAWNLYVDRTESIFDSLKGATFTEDVSRFRNRLKVSGAAGTTTAIADDIASQAFYGIFEDQVSLSDVKDNMILAAYANAEIAVQRRPDINGLGIVCARPPLTYNILPMADQDYVEVPGIFDEWQLGDKIYFTVSKGGYGFEKQAIRPFSVSLDLDNGEKITSISLQPA
jgi:hypothetical protein